MLGAQQVLADIGCDHGRFGITALRRGLCSRVIASDISAPSLEKARRLADKEALGNRIEFRCCDGLTGYAPGEATGAALLGMGGELIASILERGKEAAHGFSRIVMQPMRGEAELRKHLYENGYAVRDECVVFDAGRYYQLIAAEYAPDESSSLPSDWPEDYYQFGPVAFNKHEAELLPMLKRYKAVMDRKLAAAASAYKPKVNDMTAVNEAVGELSAMLKELVKKPEPELFNISYLSLTDPSADLSIPVDELNRKAAEVTESNFMESFIEAAKKGVIYSYNEALNKKKALLPELEKAKAFYGGDFSKGESVKYCKELANKVEGSIDQIEFIKDSTAYTFRSSMSHAIERFFYFMKRNPKEEARFARQTKRRDNLIKRGKTVTWKVVPKVIYPAEELRGNIVKIVDRLDEHYDNYIETEVDFDKRTGDLIDHFKEESSLMVYHVTKTQAKEKAIKLMKEVGIHEPRRRYYQYPFEFSGGMRQRIVIAIALAANPEILICDEPTTALDVTIQSQILELINKLKAERNLSIIFITHDLGVVANMADNIAVMYAGKIVEYGTADEIFYDPRHPYTWALLSSMPDLDTKEKLDAIPGTPPNMIYPPDGDAFAARNKYAMKIDFEEQPPFFQISETHKAATWLLHPDAPKVERPKTISDRIDRMNAKRIGGEQNA